MPNDTVFELSLVLSCTNPQGLDRIGDREAGAERGGRDSAVALAGLEAFPLPIQGDTTNVRLARK